MKIKTLHKNSINNDESVVALVALANEGTALQVPANCYAVNKRLAREVTNGNLLVELNDHGTMYYMKFVSIAKPGFIAGQKLYAIGLDMKCKHVVCVVTFVRYTCKVSMPPIGATNREACIYDCVICESVKSYSNSDELYLTRAEAEAILKAQH